jgi:hypothetical protein
MEARKDEHEELKLLV